MAYISSNANRFYAALESAYGQAATVHAGNRIPALKLAVSQQQEITKRQDKTGSRTFAGLPTGGRRHTAFQLHTYMTTWQSSNGGPAYGPLFQAALGAAPLNSSGGTVATETSAGQVGFTNPHGLTVGQAVSCNGEVRFVAAVVDPSTIQLNVPFTNTPSAGSTVAPTITYLPATNLSSISIYDYWDPSTAVQRMLCGAAVDELDILVNGDFHEFHFSGVAQDLVDSSSYGGQISNAQAYPAEPTLQGFDYSIVPGNLGQAWLGNTPTQFFTITKASVVLKNNLDLRTREFGFSLPQAISPGERSVTATIELFSQDDSATTGLYQAARQRSPISMMFQLGQTQGQVMAIQLNSVVPEVPEFDDGQNRLQWQFRPSRAQGTSDNEITIAFG